MMTERGDETPSGRMRQLTRERCLCYHTLRSGGRTSLESPTMHLVVGGLFRMRAWCRGVSSNRSRLDAPAGQATSEAERVNAVHVSSFQENRKFSRIKAKYGNCVTCHHVAHSLIVF